MQREKFEYKNSILGCEWAIIAPIAISLVFSLLAIIISKASGIEISALLKDSVFLTLATVGTELGFFVVAICIAKRARVNLVTGIGVRTKSPIWVYVGAIVLGGCVLFLLNPIINCWQALIQNSGYKVSTLPFELNSVGMLLLGILVFALLPAVCEEILFRGVILQGLRSYGIKVSVGMSALFFSIMHMNLLQIPYTFLLGIALGLVAYFTRNIWLCVIMHFINNALVLLIGYLSTEEYVFVWTDILWGVGGLIIFSILLYFVYRVLKKFFDEPALEKEDNGHTTIPLISQQKMWVLPVLLGVVCLVISILGGFGVL